MFARLQRLTQQVYGALTATKSSGRWTRIRISYGDLAGRLAVVCSTLLAWLTQRRTIAGQFVSRSQSFAFGLILAVVQAPAGGALRCFEKNHETGIIEINDDPRLLYCGVSPALWKHTERNASNYGLAFVNDDLSPYEEVFKHRDGGYDVLTICIFEKQDFRQMAVNAHVEFTFRCVCNYDLCNGPLLFTNYLRNLEQTQMLAERLDFRNPMETALFDDQQSLAQMFDE